MQNRPAVPAVVGVNTIDAAADSVDDDNVDLIAFVPIGCGCDQESLGAVC